MLFIDRTGAKTSDQLIFENRKTECLCIEKEIYKSSSDRLSLCPSAFQSLCLFVFLHLCLSVSLFYTVKIALFHFYCCLKFCLVKSMWTLYLHSSSLSLHRLLGLSDSQTTGYAENYLLKNGSSNLGMVSCGSARMDRLQEELELSSGIASVVAGERDLLFNP